MKKHTFCVKTLAGIDYTVKREWLEFASSVSSIKKLEAMAKRTAKQLYLSRVILSAKLVTSVPLV